MKDGAEQCRHLALSAAIQGPPHSQIWLRNGSPAATSLPWQSRVVLGSVVGDGGGAGDGATPTAAIAGFAASSLGGEGARG